MLVLQNWDCPRGAFDWREWATSYGFFLSEEEAEEFLRQHFANPGGHVILTHEDVQQWSDPAWSTLARTAERNRGEVERTSLGGGVWLRLGHAPRHDRR
jgi:hypothetical protein